MKSELLKRILSSIILIPIAIFFIFQGSVFFAFFLCIFFVVSSYEWIKMNKKDSLKILGLFYLLLISYLTFLFRENFFFQLILVIVICIFTDLGGYIFGKILKGPKLTKISPKKTYAGVIGGYVCSISFIILFYSNSSYLTKYLNFDFIDLKDSFMLFILAFIISSVSQLGDIIVSYFKRKTKIKNTGNIIPGHGRLLDRIDGMVFAFPASFLLYKILF